MFVKVLTRNALCDIMKENKRSFNSSRRKYGMMQIFFFLSMLTVAALMIQLFWYLEDSHREEDRVSRSRNPARSIRQGNADVCSVNHRTSAQAISVDYPFYKVQHASSRKQTSAKQSFSRFYDVGTEMETLPDYSPSMDQDRCA